MTDAGFIRDIALVFVAALVGGAFAQWLRQPMFVGYGPGFCRDDSLRRARIRERTGVTVLAVRRADGTEIVNPEPDVVLRLGDEVTVTGLPEQIALFEHLNEETA